MSLRPGDLESLVLTRLSLDEYKSKLGNDRDIIVMAIGVSEESAAHDLGDFIERGPFKIWDVDISPAPDKFGNYIVFIELARSHLMWHTIIAIFEHTEKLTGNTLDEMTFVCPGNERAQLLTEENFRDNILQTPYRWDIAHGVYPGLPEEEPDAVEQTKEQIQKRVRFLTGY